MRILLSLFCCLLVLNACKTQHENKATTGQQISVTCLDSIAAAAAIIQDEKEQFFQEIGVLDMSIQMKKNYPTETDRTVILADYKKYIQEDALNFTTEEVRFLTALFEEINEDCSKLSASLDFENIKLIKTRGRYYGSTAYFTRENCIIIPAAQLNTDNKASLKQTMYHELFHIYSRYHPKKRDSLYALIGFRPIGVPSNFRMYDSLKYKILLNPDGINYAYAISLKAKDGHTVDALPIITSNTNKYIPSKPDFFNYLRFELFPIKSGYTDRIESTPEGTSTIQFADYDFFEQIKDNTNYIIHPDEILADNFMMLLTSYSNPSLRKGLSKEGQDLMTKVEQVLKQ